MGGEIAAEAAAVAENVTASDVIAESAAVMAENDTAEPAEAILAEKGEPEIVKIVFNDGPQPDEKEIQKAIAQAKAEAAATLAEPAASDNNVEAVAVSAEAEDNEAVAAMAPAENAAVPENAEKPKKVRRSHGLPRLLVDAQNNNVEISAFNINIKLP